MRHLFRHILCSTLLLGGLAAFVSCSTTRRLGKGEVLYTGVRKMTFTPAEDSLRIPAEVISAVRQPLNVAPNNALWSPYWRTGIPIRLWAWNYLYTPKEKGFKYWFYKRLAKPPVLISKVRPELRVKVTEQLFENHGYFDAHGSYELVPSKHKPDQKAKVNYRFTVSAPYTYDSIEYLTAPGRVGRIVDSLHAGTLLRKGAVYNLDTLVAERNRITTALRSLGYYYFRPEYIAYDADTTQAPRRVSLRMRLADGIPPAAMQAYRIGSVRVTLVNPAPGPFDTMTLGAVRVRYQQPLKIRPRILAGTIRLTPGQIFNVEAQNRTQSDLNKLGIFNSVSLSVPPIDSLHEGQDSLDVHIYAAFDKPMQAEFEADFNSKSNSYLGPGVTFGLRHNNIFKGGEVLALNLTGSYEWQTGNKSQYETRPSAVNSYEFGLNASLSVPRILAPGFRYRGFTYPAHTTYKIGADLMNRPKYFRMLSLNLSAGFDFRTSPYSSHNLTIFKLTYNRLLHTSHVFDSTMQQNPAVALSFSNQFIPAISYAYTFDRLYGSRQRNRFIFQGTVTEAGNILAGLYGLFGSHGEKRLFGSPFSQFVKGTAEVKWYHRVGLDNWLVSRFLIGAGYAYGNSKVMPYSEQFYIGGANSIRAFTVRSLGPGSYRPPKEMVNGYWDQTGSFKLEANVEMRFKIMGRLGGAVFVDAGNIWLLKNDPQRPGGVLRAKNFWKEIALGTGVGLRYDISVLVLRLDMGIGIHTPYPNPDKRGYYNISKFKDGLGLHLAIGYPF
ncbi:BamA/TamA family outer membrane protein [uncultured Rikenella sp.]|uniref:translocation and assembly module lipoprotein TamL n=1 Tax=uncultured Rikenella sp. TaxID=368003 RepID=UPI00262E302A|nr:BamA/TamA family outer membrane protein [uncultured Rikenella sp.]